jgi:hypothetical protein
MPAFLLDENMSPVVAEQVIRKAADAVVFSIQHWRTGRYMGADDATLLMAAHEEGLTLITYDLQTILPLLKDWAVEGINHSGVVGIDDKTIRQHDLGGQIKAIVSFIEQTKYADLSSSFLYLRPVRE